MGVSTDGIICYGVLREEEEEPFEGLNDCDGEEEWWCQRNGYEPPFEMFDSNGEWIGGKDQWPPEKVREYFDHQRAWDAEHPMPFELVNTCHSDVPRWIIALPGSVTRASRGYPVAISEGTVSLVHKEAALERYLAFLKEMKIEDKPRWWLGSYWG